MTATATEASSARDALLACLASASGPVSRTDISSMTGIALGNVGVLLHRLASAGVVQAASRGQWQIARPEAQLAIREPDVVQPAKRVASPGQDGADLLDAIGRYVDHFAVLPSRAARTALILWCAHTHLRQSDGQLAADYSPRLFLTSESPGSGKSSVLELVRLLSARTDSAIIVEPSAAALRAMLSAEHATIVMDEVDQYFRASRHGDVRAILNAGVIPSGTVVVMRAREVLRQNVFGPVAMAGLAVVTEGATGALAALLTRSIVITMRKPADGARISDITCSRAGQAAGAKACDLLGQWTAQHREEILSAEHEPIDGIRLRDEQVWRVLRQVAGAAGGDWPRLAREAALEMAQAVVAEPEEQRDELADFIDLIDTADFREE